MDYFPNCEAMFLQMKNCSLKCIQTFVKLRALQRNCNHNLRKTCECCYSLWVELCKNLWDEIFKQCQSQTSDVSNTSMHIQSCKTERCYLSCRLDNCILASQHESSTELVLNSLDNRIETVRVRM